MTDADITSAAKSDPDAPPLEMDWSAAEVVNPMTKQAISIRLDADIVEHFKAMGPGYQTRINDVLRSFVKHARASDRSG